ncbi:adenosylcobinamide-GDP ribazoletransferase [Hylemonella gracilis]|uniref:Adenosylcobinamide-GDP ribazoletransferase n=1 Tax=Hylemonella gracilis TaxID=80880 RepID=A0A4P6UJW8_9BURK|nr:adenosylcobinamide-GDP ribazoletransferase [Hylemonella gracilis]QBK05353.1 adenosylcobinamide-GDP ribazoletransferase [Hylemonella gracilis]
MNFVRHYLLALQFFTRVPVTGRLAAWVGYSPDMLRQSAAHFPGVGWLVGLLAALGYAGLDWALPDSGYAPLVAAVLVTVFTVLLTGAFHEDGLADVADGLGGSHERERALDIMKDSRIGAYGAVALVLALLSKIALLALLGDADPALACGALFFAHVVTRFLPLWLIRLLPHVGDTGRSKSKPLADRISAGSLAVATLWTAAAAALSWWWLPEALFWFSGAAASLLASLWMGRLFARRLQGYTGDCLGATQQVCEIACYLGLALGLSWIP